jgi:signal transduction histidine kinase/DNA-binding response OmpR family regulator/ligand-binding sensor domain-containing protein
LNRFFSRIDTTCKHLFLIPELNFSWKTATQLLVVTISSLLILSGSLFAQATNPYTPKLANPFSEPWRWQGFSELIGKGCRCMIEDKNDALWFGVNGGVYKYDGINWKFYSLTKDSSDIPVVSLCIDSEGSLYAGTTKGISKLKQGKWESIKIDLGLGDPVDHPYNKIPIIESSDHSIWIGTHQGSVRIKDGQMTLYRENEVYSDLQQKENKYIFDDLQKLSPFDVYNIFQDKSGKVWFGLRDGRIYNCQFNGYDLKTNPKWYRVDTEKGYVKTRFPLIKISSSGSIFIASGQNDGGVNINNGRGWTQFKSKRTFSFDDLYSDIIELKDGSICVGGIGRVFIYQSGNWKMYESINLPFSSNRLILYESKDQNLFIIGLGNEVWRIDLSYQKWATFKGLSFQAEDKNKDKWFISVDGLVVKCDPQMKKWVRYSKKDGVIDVPVTILVSKNGNIWVAGSDNQIAATSCFDGKKWTKQIHHKLGWGIERRAAFESSDGSLWFGSASDIAIEKGQLGGLVRYANINDLNNIQFEYHYSNENFRITGIYGIGETPDGAMWTGQLGFYKLLPNSDKWKKILEPSGLNASFIDCIQSSSTGDLWVGTRTNGVYHYNHKTGKWNRFTIKDGLSSNSIINIYVESSHNVWVVTNRDISHFDGRNWTRNSFHSFLKPKMDGIAIKATKDGAIWVDQNLPAWYRKALYKDSFSGESYDDFSTTRYYPDKLPPQTVITFSQEKIAQPGNVLLSWTANDPWKITPAEQLQYSYRIDDNAWSAYTYKTSDIFLSLSSGEHTFEVRARDRDMNVDPSPAEVSFYVVHPIWAQPWFILLILSFLAIIAFFMQHLYARNKIIAEMSETKVRLFANISHELRTPLTLIMGPLLKVLESPVLNDELKKPLNLVNRNCHRLLRLINQVLDFRKMEAGQLKFEPKKGDIIDFLREEVFVFEEFAESKKIDLKIETEINKLEVWFDPDKMEKTMFNLLSNALKFTPHYGNVIVKINRSIASRVRTIDLGLPKSIKFSEWLEITIKDSGVGIAKRNLNKVFDNFYQVQDHLKTAVGGTGIGLSVAKEMVKTHGGKISVESEEGIGTSFIVKIPIITEEVYEGPVESDLIQKSEYIKMKYPENEEETEAIHDEENHTEGRSKILVVEDNADMRRYIREELEKEFEIIESVNGEDGLNKALSTGPDLILSDIMMPQMDGIEFCKKIKSDERTSHIAVILLTARSSQEYKMEGLETGADDYLIKPFYSAELLIRIHNIMETRKKLREKFGKNLQFEPNSIDITSVDQKFLKRAIDIIEEHLDDSEFNVETFSKLVGMSRVSLYNKLKSLTNHSVQEFIFAIRLKRAAQLIRESGMTITEIAYSVGFKDPSHFSKLFKKQFGVSPKSYANKDAT